MTVLQAQDSSARSQRYGQAPDDDVVARLVRRLEESVTGEVRFSDGDRALYATDASNFRQVPIGVVLPRSAEDVIATVAACREHGVPILSRGGGTSLAGQCCNVAVVMDHSKHYNRILEIDPERRVARVQPGVVLDTLRDEAKRHGLTFGPDPATHDHCTLGGMIGNNSCGVHALMAGKTVDNVVSLDVLLYDGTRMTVGETSREELEQIIAAGGRRGEIYAAMRELRDRHLEAIRTRYPDIPRRVSGYNLDSLLPENGFHVAQALVGSESTLVTVLEAELRLVPEPKARSLVVLGFRDVVQAARQVPALLEHDPIGLEGLDDRLVEQVRRKHMHPDAQHKLPHGAGWLLVEFGDDSREQADARAQRMIEATHHFDDPPLAKLFDDPAEEAMVWEVRESGLGATARSADGDHWPGWEDSAVRVDQLADYLVDLQQLYDEFGYSGALYGHFGQACLHTRINFDLASAEGIARYRQFLERAARLVVSYGGSLSGEHGDGQQRAELLPVMFGDEVVRAFAQFKAIFDPDDRMNPGKVVRPRKLDEDLRIGTDYNPPPLTTVFAYPDDSGSFARAAMRCVGVGKCRRHDGGVMCPSYMVTREEKHSTRGRARLLWEMLNGHLRDQGWRSTEVRDALDLCLACKGCKSDCPVDVDMATYKAEFLHHHYKRRLRPAAHYSMGWLPVAATVAAVAPGVVNALAHAPGLSALVKRVGGIAQERDIPRFAPQTFQGWWRERGGSHAAADAREVMLWPDTFSNHFHPHVAQAAVEVLEAAGLRVTVPDKALCCGLTWISTGQLEVAKAVYRRTVDALGEAIDRGVPLIGLEPSCTAVFRSDATDLFPHDQQVQRLKRQTFTLAEALQRFAPDWEPPDVGRRAVVQTHCHQHAVLGFGQEEALLRRAGIDADVLDSGCCGLAGNFGFEAGHYDVSMAAGERVLLPAVREADATTAVLADGFSCRTQIAQGGTGREAIHLAEALALGLRGEPAAGRRPEDAVPRPTGGSPVPALAGGLGVLAVAAWLAARRS